MGAFYDRMLEMFQLGVLAMLGGLANYLYVTVEKNRKFSIWMLLVNLFLAFYVGNVTGSFIDPQSEWRDGILMVAGFATYPLLAFVEAQAKRIFASVVERWLDKWLGPAKPRRDEPEE